MSLKNKTKKNKGGSKSNTTTNNEDKKIANKLANKKKTYKVIKMLSNIKKFQEFYKKLNLEEKDTIKDYKGIGYKIINDYLYNGNTIKQLYFNEHLFKSRIQSQFSKNTKELFSFKNIDVTNIPKFVEFYINNIIIKKINILDSLFENKDIPRLDGTEILFRGTNGHTGTTDKSKVGDEIIFKNFLSSSTEKEVSMNFTSFKPNKDICCMYILSGLKNLPYIYIPFYNEKIDKILIHNSSFDEFEYLLPRNLKFKITGISKGIKNMVNEFNSFKKLTFEQLEKFIKNKNLDKMNNSDIEIIIDKIFNKVKFIHLEYIEQIPLMKIPNYVYNENLNLHFSNPTMHNPHSKKYNSI